MSNIKERVKEILEANDLDFQIEKAPMTCTLASGKVVTTPYYGLVNSKSGEVINTCKVGYGISQNADVIEMVLKGAEKFGSDLKVTNAGALNGGRQVFAQLLINGIGKVGNDTLKKYITVIDSNDGSTSLSVGIGDFTMSCSNQFFRFYKAGNSRFRHTATIEQKISEIPYLIELALGESMRQIEVYNKFVSTSVSRDLAHKMVNAVIGYDRLMTDYSKVAKDGKLSNKQTEIMKSLYDHIYKEMDGKGENLWGLHSGVTSWTTHEKKGPKRSNGRIEGQLVGVAYEKNMTSFNFAVNEAGILVAN